MMRLQQAQLKLLRLIAVSWKLLLRRMRVNSRIVRRLNDSTPDERPKSSKGTRSAQTKAEIREQMWQKHVLTELDPKSENQKEELFEYYKR